MVVTDHIMTSDDHITPLFTDGFPMQSYTLPSHAASVPIAHLLRVASAQTEPLRTIALGISIHLLADPLLQETELGLIQIHRATTTLTKQVLSELSEGAGLRALRPLLLDPDRPALPDRLPIRELCAGSWERVESWTADRLDVAIADAGMYGDQAVLRLAATRAVRPAFPWWGTAEWQSVVEQWIRHGRRSRALQRALLEAPEAVEPVLLAAALSSSSGFSAWTRPPMIRG